MSDADVVILKLLGGMQAGVEVSLVPGEYSVGTGPDDDIQLIDVSIRASHARLRVSPGTIELAGAAGSMRTAAGTVFEPNGAWQELQPLDVVTLGTTRIALGHPTSQWASIAEDDGAGSAPAGPSATGWRGGLAEVGGRRLYSIVAPLAALALLLGFAAWLILGGGLGRITGAGTQERDDLALTREALDRFPFGRTVETHREVDGLIYVNGYVETPVERRALTAAIEKTAVPARIRLSVLQTIRSEVESLITAQKVPVTFRLAPNGALTLDGLILNEARAARFVDLVKERVLGVGEVRTQIRTAATLLREIERLAVSAQIQPFVLLRVNDDLVEATGAIPAEKVDAFVGFLQSYARRFARDIPLRSFVQLQGVARTAASGPIVIGAPASGGDLSLDVDRLVQGAYRPSDLLPGSDPRTGPARPAATPFPAAGPRIAAAPGGGRIPGLLAELGRERPVAAQTEAPRQGLDPMTPVAADGGKASDTTKFSDAVKTPDGAKTSDAMKAAERGSADATASVAADPPKPAAPAAGGGSDAATPVVGVPKAAGSELGGLSRRLLERWRAGGLDGDAGSQALQKALEALRAADPGAGAKRVAPDWYLPILKEGGGSPDAPCWPGAQIRPGDTLSALFWLDLMTVTEAVTLTEMGRDLQLVLLESALNPTRLAACARRTPDAARAADHSLFLREIGRNPSFVRFLVRDLPAFALDITGANLLQTPYILTRAGRRLYEGSAPDQASRIAAIGELGVAVQLKADLAAVVFEPDLSWKITQ